MSDPVLCTLARQHSGDCAHTETPARHACRKVIRYKGPLLTPAAVATLARDAVDRDLAHHVDDGEPFDPVAHAAAMAEAKEALRLPHEVAAEHNHEGFGEATFPPSCPLCVTLLASLAPPEPSTADLIAAHATIDAACLDAIRAVGSARSALGMAEARRSEALGDLARARSALAKHVGAGKFVQVGGATFKAIAQRKPRGWELAADALWRLEPVEVAR